jgi:beta-glucosidase
LNYSFFSSLILLFPLITIIYRFELYYPPFEAAVKAGVYSVMCSYNRINDVYACNNNETMSHLFNSLGFDGWVMSDWTATRGTVQSLNAGLHQEMPVGVFYRESAIMEALDANEVSYETIDNGILRMLTAMYDVGLFDHPPTGDRNAIVTSESHNALTREIVSKSTVLLRNEPVAVAAAAAAGLSLHCCYW